MEKKKLDNVTDNSDPALITKKFWSYVKSTSNSHRIPETVSYRQKFRNNPKDQTELFNEYFFDQFTEASGYNVSINWDNCDSFDIEFNEERILKLLKGINTNKTPGPDLLHGKFLKECAHNVAYPLSLIYRTAYLTGQIP